MTRHEWQIFPKKNQEEGENNPKMTKRGRDEWQTRVVAGHGFPISSAHFCWLANIESLILERGEPECDL